MQAHAALARETQEMLRSAERGALRQDDVDALVRALERGRAVLALCPGSLRAAEVVAGTAATLRLRTRRVTAPFQSPIWKRRSNACTRTCPVAFRNTQSL